MPMVKKLVSRSEFAEMAGVSPGAVTKAARKALLPAVSGKRIDAGHAAARAYIKSKAPGPTPPAPGIDPKYTEAVEACNNAGRCSVSYITRNLGMGRPRATRIYEMIMSTGAYVGKPPEAPAAEAPGKTAYKKRGRAAAKETKKREAPPLVEIADDNEHLAGLIDMTLRAILAQFGTDTRFVDWLTAVSKIEGILEKRIKNAQAMGELINRELVKRGIIEPIDTMLTKMLTDGARTISVRAKALIESGGDEKQVEALIVDLLTSFIKPAKLQMSKALREGNSAGP